MKNPCPNDEITEFLTVIQKNKNTRSATPYYITSVQRRALLQLGDSVYILFSYYMEKARVDGFDFDDNRVSAALGYPVRRVQKLRLTLIKAGWFIQSTFKNKKGRRVKLTYLGQAAVHAFKKNGNTIRITQSNLDLFQDN